MSGRDAREKRRTVVKTFRLPEDLLISLEKESEEKETTLNALVTTALIRHSEWGSMARKLGMVSVSKPLLMAILESADDEKLAATSRKMIPPGWRDMATFKFHDYSLDSLIQLLKLIMKHGWEADVDVSKDGKKYLISFRHSLGPKFSLVMKNALDEALRNTFHVQPAIETGEYSVIARFSVS